MFHRALYYVGISECLITGYDYGSGLVLVMNSHISYHWYHMYNSDSSLGVLY